MPWSIVGSVALDISLIIYLIRYLPQLIYNQKQAYIHQISLTTQLLMVLANGFDLLYGIGLGLPWQYQLVSFVTLGFLVVQQVQIQKAYQNVPKQHYLGWFVTILSIIGLFIPWPYMFLLTLGWISSGSYLIYWIPQIIQNSQQQQGRGFSPQFMGLSLMSVFCDVIAAWFLYWPLPSLVTPLVTLSLYLIMIAQYYQHQSKIHIKRSVQ